MSDVQRPISTETALRALVKPQRRRVVRRVADADDETSVDHLAEQLSERETGPLTPSGDGEAGRRRVQLHHRHLPMLADAGVVSYDAESGTVQRGEHFGDIYSLLQALDDHSDDLPSH